MTILLAVVAAATISAARPAPLDADIAWVARGDFCEPETVLPLPDDTLLISNVCDFRKTGNGFLSLLAADGSVLNWRVVDDLDAPLGMTLLDGQLYVVDNNQVRVLAWPGYKPLETIALSTKVANDIAVAADGTLYVTDTAEHLVVRRLADGTESIVTGKAQFESANGIALNGEHLYVGGKRLWCVDLASGNVKTIGPAWLADIDGIEFESDGTLQITPVGGPLIRYRNDDDVSILAGDGVSSANHGYAARLGLALIPTGFDNSVIAIRVAGAAAP